jgi:hypothetical protein
MKSLGDLSLLLDDLALYYSGTIMPLLARANPKDFEIEAIGLAIAGRNSHWVAIATRRFPGEASAAETHDDSADPEAVTASGRRRGYRKEVRQWLTHEGLRTLPEAAKELGISLSVLKSISSDRGKRRYSEATLTRVLEIIGRPVE